jgi:hypothetical protein
VTTTPSTPSARHRDRLDQRFEVVEAQGSAGNPAEVLDLDGDAQLGQAGHGRDKLVSRKDWYDTTAFAGGHRDRAA